MAEANGGPWWLAAAASAQLAVGIASYRRGRGGDPALMPFKAFLVASLFVGAGATAAVVFLRAAGVRRVEDAHAAGKSLRKWIGAPDKDRSPTAAVD
ncbi:stAR lipid transfer-like protein [Wolffia australiana]